MSIRKTITALALCAAACPSQAQAPHSPKKSSANSPPPRPAPTNSKNSPTKATRPLFCAPVTDDQNGPNNLIRD
ncbi:hypothetical protein [Saccharopolyspora gregorii]|uniref:Uncharacterized protein n=1 Tax=Saccharopolyspora gregorii TaxID=33914 RepID=A0ABP6RK32_9PSEU